MKRKPKQKPAFSPMAVGSVPQGSPYSPFRAGRVVTCLLCDKVQDIPFGERVSTDWRAAEIGKKFYYACPEHFPPEGSTPEAFQNAYNGFLKCAFGKATGQW